MAVLKYGLNEMKENMVKASGRNLNVSAKQCIEICNHIRGRKLKQAKMMLQDSMDIKRAIPFKRFTNGLGHKPGMGSGRFAPKACAEILRVLKSAEGNAKNKGFNAADLVVTHIATQRAPKTWHYGRQSRTQFKSVHIEVVLAEVKEVKIIDGKKKDTKKKDAVKKD